MARWRAFRGGVLLYAFVAAGAAIGGVGRALVSLASIELAGSRFPWGTLVANAVGSFFIGFYATLTEPGANIGLSIVSSLLAVWAGAIMAARLNRLSGDRAPSASTE